MPYFFESLQTSLDDDHFWDRLEEMFDILAHDLRTARFETEPEAIDRKYRNSSDPNDLRLDSLFVVRFRQSDDRDNLEYFYEMGLAAATTVGKLIKKRRLTAKFVEQWSMLVSCHGFVTASVMALGNDAHRLRSGKAGGDAVKNRFADQQRQWFAHYFVSNYKRRGDRPRVEHRIEALVNQIVRGAVPLPKGSSIAFFDGMLKPAKAGRDRELKSPFRDNKLSIERMRELVLEPTDKIPLLKKLLPLPKV